MPFPAVSASWPPAEWATAFDQYAVNEAWWTGDQQALQEIYAAAGSGSSRGDNDATHYNKGDGTARRGGVRGFLSRMFNGRIVPTGEDRTRLHAPIGANLATLSADLLFSEAPTVRLYDAAGKVLKSPIQARLDKIGNGEAARRTMIDGGEITAGLGASVLTAHWDREVADAPWMQVAPCDAATPEFIGGRLTAVNLYTTYPQMSAAGTLGKVYVHIERHEVGKIIHGLAELSTTGTITRFVPMDTIDATAHLVAIRGARGGDSVEAPENTVITDTGIERLTASWWRNLPTRAHRKDASLALLGRADTEGAEQFLDAADEVWSSWMRDIKLARARLVVPEAYMDLTGPGLGGSFDDSREILTPVGIANLSGKDSQITAHQFLIRATEHAETLLALTREITQSAGYSLSSYGERSDAGGVTATEVVDRTTMTERTRDKKALHFKAAAVPLFEALLDLDRVHYRGQAVPEGAEIRIDFTELSQIDPEKEARVFTALRAANAVSTDTLVRMFHPDWEDKQIGEEIDRIREEAGYGEALSDPVLVGRSTVPEPTDPDRDNDPDADADGLPADDREGVAA